MRVKGKQVRAIRWEQIRAVQRISTIGKAPRVSQEYILYLEDDKPLEIKRGLAGFEALGIKIEQEVRQRLLPEAITAHEAGQTLNFGKVNVMPQGLSLEEEPKTISWENLRNISEFKGYIFIKEHRAPRPQSPWESG